MDIEFNKNEDSLKLLVSTMKQRLSKVGEGGGKKSIEKLHEKGKLHARERIKLLFDKDKPWIE
jgi:3-methylcrotonyl-CoA carboxylase beta subunit